GPWRAGPPLRPLSPPIWPKISLCPGPFAWHKSCYHFPLRSLSTPFMPSASTSPRKPKPEAPALVPGHRPAADPPAEIFRSLILRHLTSTLARHAGSAAPRDWWVATALAVRDHIHERMIATQAVHNAQNVRRVYYF